MKPRRRFDVVVMGSGLGGLVTGLLLAKSGKKVCMLEKNNQYGGNLQTFVRDKVIFDSGVHYIGSLHPHENLGRFFSYLGILDDIQLEQMQPDAFDYVSFGSEDIRYPQAQGYDNFIQQLLPYFPDEKQTLTDYIDTIRYYCTQFPLYDLKKGFSYNEQIMGNSVKTVLSAITDNRRLQAVLLGNGFLYALHEDSPFYMHALVVNSYIQSSWRCIRGGSQISKAFTKQLRLHHAKLYTYQEVLKLHFDENTISACETQDYIYEADHFVSNMSLKKLFELFDENNSKKAYVKRIEQLKESPSVFSTHLVLKPDIIRYFNHNIYHFDNIEDVFTYSGNSKNERPRSVMISSTPHDRNQQFANNISLMTYMDYSQVSPWHTTTNTVQKPQDRGTDYAVFKEQMAQRMIDILCKYIPNVRDNIVSIHTSTPLTYRDYIGTKTGSMYGIEKHADHPLKTLISPRTKVSNLFLSGQDVRLHGILGVTITGFMAAGELLGRDSFFNEVFEEAKK